MKVLMLAPPGGGKGTQGVRIAAELGVEHISSGDLLRAAVAEDTPLGREVAAHLATGRLAPDELVVQAVKPVLDRRGGYVLDGFPRTLSQAGGLEFDAVVHLDVPDDVTRRRLLARGRADDSADVIAKRLRQYAHDTEPLVALYRDQGVLVQVDGDRPPDEITAELLQRLKRS
jgi:adenylate kinase